MPSPQKTLISVLATSLATTANAAHLRAVWTTGSFQTTPGPGGNGESGHFTGFTILNDKNEAIFNSKTPGEKSPCFSTKGGREFTMGDDPCWHQDRKFQCKSNLAGNTEGCEVKDQDGNSLGTGEGKTDTTFIGIAIGQDSTCVVEFNTDDDEDCGANSGLKVKSG
ncbi:hypothetical protein FSARC_13512 [Fusarium sarcochroum]|uniref:Uncharacterized protein n=1 Tax=Fusarium sarcochroum TaxID=1208366 RepID=A0A8H4T0Y7_9HYPO|nr:hypothetical protein FSARC_13512 [Fusarium sarcochroum]